MCFSAIYPGALTAGQDQDSRSIRVIRVGSPPDIDGRFDEDFWKQADWQGDFRQLKPDLGQPARARTMVTVAFGAEKIYAAFRCFNPTGRSANSKITRRDGDMDQDNAVTFYLDTFHTRRDCYYFSTN